MHCLSANPDSVATPVKMPAKLDYGAKNVCEPEFSKWHSLLVKNRARLDSYGHSAPLSNRSTVRTEVLEAAVEYTAEFKRIATDSTPPAKERFPAGIGSSDGELIMTGHQPVIFHPGILYKTVLLSRFARENTATGILVLVDTVEGDAGEFLVPSIQNGVYQIRHESVCSESGPMSQQRIADRHVLGEVFARAYSDLFALGFHKEARQTADAGKRYVLLAGQPVGMANSIVRRAYEGEPTYLEVPMSRLIRLPSVRSFFRRLLEDAVRFHDVYNQTLDTFRDEHKIRNVANPFPNLRTKDSSRELPFWHIHGQSGLREPLFTNSEKLTWNDSDSGITPRGMLITILLRLLGSDLFIHGTGGASYDRCTDRFMTNYFDVVPPSFCVASATRYLFARELARQEQFEHRDKRLRDMVYNTERYLAEDAFPAATRSTLEPLVARKRELIRQLKEAKTSGRPASDFGKELHGTDEQLKKVVEETLNRQLAGIHRLKSEQRKLIANREFPYFYFPPGDPMR